MKGKEDGGGGITEDSEVAGPGAGRAVVPLPEAGEEEAWLGQGVGGGGGGGRRRRGKCSFRYSGFGKMVHNTEGHVGYIIPRILHASAHSDNTEHPQTTLQFIKHAGTLFIPKQPCDVGSISLTYTAENLEVS